VTAAGHQGSLWGVRGGTVCTVQRPVAPAAGAILHGSSTSSQASSEEVHQQILSWSEEEVHQQILSWSEKATVRSRSRSSRIVGAGLGSEEAEKQISGPVVQSHLAYWRSGDLSLRSLSAGGEAMELFVQGGRRNQTGRMAMASVYSTKKKASPKTKSGVV
jgi:hypothetical protein